jgi:hypothetical protein
MSKLVKLAPGQKEQYVVGILDKDGKPLSLRTGEQVVVTSHDPAVRVVPDATPLPDTVASGYVQAGDQPVAAVSIQATLKNADGSHDHAVLQVDVGEVPPAPEVKPVEPPVRNLVIDLVNVKPAETPAEPPPQESH